MSTKSSDQAIKRQASSDLKSQESRVKSQVFLLIPKRLFHACTALRASLRFTLCALRFALRFSLRFTSRFSHFAPHLHISFYGPSLCATFTHFLLWTVAKSQSRKVGTAASTEVIQVPRQKVGAKLALFSSAKVGIEKTVFDRLATCHKILA